MSRPGLLAQSFAVALGLLVACGDSARVREVEEPGAPAATGAAPAADATLPSAAAIPVAAPATAHGPPYPLILVHGFAASARVGPVDYWWKIPEMLTKSGEVVHVAATEPGRAPVDRARTLAAFVDRVIAETNAKKVNLVGHSMGGLDARLLVSQLGYGDRVASITTLATPHRGSPVADAILGLIPSRLTGDVENLVNVLATFVDGDRQDVLAAARVLSTAGAAEFNRAHPDDPRVAYYSIVAVTTADPLFLLHDVDFVDAPLWASFAYLDRLGLRSDGLVPVESQKWGEILMSVEADHYNEINQPLGVVGVAFDVEKTYLGLAQQLHQRGF